jgi:adhesin transport system outer membrane protein
LSEARLQESVARRNVELNVRSSYAAFMTARERIPILESHVDSSERALEAYGQQFILGRRTLLDVLNVENEVFGAKASLLNGQINELLSQYQILTAIGRLLETLGLAAGSLDGPESQ